MKQSIRLIGWIGLFVGLTACSSIRVPGNQDYRIVGYVHGPRGATVQPADAVRLTHINYAFANVRDGAVVLEDPNDPANLAQLIELRRQNPNLRILLSVGGWSWSENFSDAALTEASRTKFARTGVALMVRHNLDGLDIDWEYPGQKGEDNVYRPEDKQNFTRLLQTLRAHLDRQSRRDGRMGSNRYELTIATGANKTYLAHTDLRSAHIFLDAVNIMTYDYYGSWTTNTGHHTNLYASKQSDPFATSSAEAVQDHLDAGVPAQKLVLGVAFYGYGWTGVTNSNRGLYQPYSGETQSYTFADLRSRYIDQNGFVRYWDTEAQAPYLWNADDHVFITYDDERSLQRKTNFVRARGLGGVMYWEYSGDTGGRLLNTLHKGLNRRTSAQP